MSKPSIKTISAILETAGRDILQPAFQQSHKHVSDKEDGSIVTETDISCQHYIREALAAAWPDIGFLGEEMSPAEQQASLEQDERFWCLDPLDGTTNFVASFPVFGLSLGLFEQGRPTLGCIVDPLRREVFSATLGGGAMLNGAPIQAAHAESLSRSVGFIDFKRLDADRRQLFSTPGICRSQRNIGSCALEWAWLAAGRAQFIVHGGEKIWDFAAGGLIACEAGCSITDFGGKPLFENLQSASSVLAASSENLITELQDLVSI